MPTDAKVVALTTWQGVLENMPKSLQPRYALVEALKQAPLQNDRNIDEAVRKELEALAVAEFGPAQEMGQTAPEPRVHNAHRATEDDIKNTLTAVIDDAFSAPTDGSDDRAKVLADRAMGSAKACLKEDASHLGFFARRRLTGFAKRHVEKRAKEIRF